MKKSFYYMFAAASLMGFAACDEGDYADWAQPQINAQEEILPSVAEGIASSIGSVAETYDFGTLTAEAIKVFNPASTEYPTTYSLNFSNGKSLPASAEGTVRAADFHNILVELFGKRPEVRTVPATVVAITEVAGVTVRAEKAVSIQAKPQAPVIYDHFYLIGAPSQWDPTCTSMPFSHSDKDVYDDPYFTVTFPAVNGDTWFAMADDKTVETSDLSYVFACAEGNGKNLVGEWGQLIRRNEMAAVNPDGGDGSFMVSVNDDAKFIKVTVNLLDGQYLIEKVNFVPYLYFIGATDGWTNSEQRLAHQGNGYYTGYCYVADPNGWGKAFKFQQEAGNWDNEINAGTFTVKEGVTGDNNIEVAAEGVYYFEIDLANGSIRATLIEYMGITGDFTGWNEGVQMTWNAAEFCYEASAAVTAAGWKFRANGHIDPNWAVNLGGDSLNDLYNGGNNLDVAGSSVKLYPCRVGSDQIYCTVE